ncbi:Succinylglutamate desuccinylase/aspartoacylase [Stanieria cyanosphaera PCC 7437]|uniref:Succinylglutamate desuccinylase/aspartoacylase n=1 Tax=Stanieria cyanosphaera (strain ATCC 29371 / PCC 7437) TaxID=111780 RepID=K9XSM6_STAC7|nr:succinylglutamate desuccinylase/aspartoacylase family protein [Stanieria cyanosphaera]AFZ35605.1 Succinylglutamate desuccinylase/aspartoacylase [Stanieria cyanosphaera PCC 7437]
MEVNLIEIAKEIIEPGQLRRLDIPVSRLPTQTMLSLPVTVINGKQAGPKLWLSAAIHGDELNGVEIIRQVIEQVQPEKLAGTLIAVPIVNLFGFIEQSRYLPDRRDLNRSFPGSETGSLASRLANLFMREIVKHSTHGIDLHTAAIHRMNLPQIRANLEDSETYCCAQAFNAPIMMHAITRDGSLRQAATNQGIPVLLYEGGEALRFEPYAIEVGVTGVLRVMQYLGMAQFPQLPPPITSVEIRQSKWIRAFRGGIFHREVSLGQQVEKKQPLGFITDAFGEDKSIIRASVSGIVIGYNQNPLVNQGDGMINLAIKDAYAINSFKTQPY